MDLGTMSMRRKVMTLTSTKVRALTIIECSIEDSSIMSLSEQAQRFLIKGQISLVNRCPRLMVAGER